MSLGNTVHRMPHDHSTRHWQSAGCPRLPKRRSESAESEQFYFTHSHIALAAIIITSANGPGWMIIRGRQVGDMNLISLRGSLGCGSTDSLVIWMMRPTVIAVKTKETGNSLTNIWAECCTRAYKVFCFKPSAHLPDWPEGAEDFSTVNLAA